LYTFEYSINIEAVPGERCAVILCQKDKELFGEDEHTDFIYSNQWIPLSHKCNIEEKIRLGSILDKKVGGGQIAHINLNGDFANEEQAWNLLNHIAQSGVIYFAYNKRISICENEHGFNGEICPICGNPAVDFFVRIVGYLVPTSSFSKERKTETIQRYYYNTSEL
jgi:ribonucleoside-triphosphate reductase